MRSFWVSDFPVCPVWPFSNFTILFYSAFMIFLLCGKFCSFPSPPDVSGIVATPVLPAQSPLVAFGRCTQHLIAFGSTNKLVT